VPEKPLGGSNYEYLKGEKVLSSEKGLSRGRDKNSPAKGPKLVGSELTGRTGGEREKPIATKHHPGERGKRRAIG